jgi:hypothetical protein
MGRGLGYGYEGPGSKILASSFPRYGQTGKCLDREG